MRPIGDLVDVDDLVEVLDAGDLVVLAGVVLGVVELARHGLEERVDQQRRFSAARDAGDAGEEADGDRGRDVLQVVCAGADDGQHLRFIGRLARFRDRHVADAREVFAGEARRVVHDVGWRALGDDAAAVDAGARADVDDVVGVHDRVLVVFDDDDGVANVAQVLEGVEQAVVVALMQPDRRLV